MYSIVKIKTLAAFSIFAVLVAGCAKTEYSEERTELAEITEVVYTPSQHGFGTGVGMSMKGNPVVTTNNITVPETFAVVFKCEHGKFIVQRKDAWAKAVVGARVMVRYREVYEVTDEARTLVKYDFIDFSQITSNQGAN